MFSIEFYNLNVASAEFEYLGECLTFSNLTYEAALLDVGSCTFDINILDEYAKPKYMRRMSTIIVIKENGTCVWFGPMANQTGDYEDLDGYITVTGYSWLYYFKFRNTNKSQIYSQVQQSAIAWDLINTSQSETNGTLLITQGLNPTSMLRDRTYETYEIAEALTNLANVINGFDFGFEPVLDSDGRLSSVLFNVYYPTKGSVREDLGKLEMGINVSSVSWTTISELYNTVIVEGSGTGIPLIYESSDPSSQQAYTRIEGYEKASDVSEYDTLQKKGETLLNENKVEGYRLNLIIMPSSTLNKSGLEVGDTVICNLKIGNHLEFINRKARVKSIPASVDNEGVKTISLEVEIYG